MTYVLELSADELRRLEAAERIGIDVRGVLKGFIHCLPEPPFVPAPMGYGKTSAVIAFLQQLNRDGATDDPAKIHEAEMEMETVLENLRQQRYPEEAEVESAS